MTIEIDGAQGEGGGQVLRTSLTLAMCTGQNIRVKNIRAGRARPGLLRQHLTALRAAQTICGAVVSGDGLGSQDVSFEPGKIQSGEYEFKIGSAGSTTLLAQTILPALAMASAESRVRLEGGTHNGMAPSVDFIEQSFIPQIEKIGMAVTSRLETHGFYPNGGGVWQCVVASSGPLHALSLIERGELIGQRAVVKSANIETNIAERELARVKKKLGLADRFLEGQRVRSPGPGNIVSIRVSCENITEVFESVGVLGVSAERVAGKAIAGAKRYLIGAYPVGEYLADQLLIPMVVGQGGEFITGPVTGHTKTNIAVIEQMLGQSCIEICETSAGTLIRVKQLDL